MLILTLKPGEPAVIQFDGRTVEVDIIETKGKQVVVGFSAPREVSIDRKKVWERKRQATLSDSTA